MINSIRPSQLAQWIASCREESSECVPLVLDVREAWEVQTACVKPEGFEYLHMPMHTIPARASELQRERPIACLCHHGGRSAQVTYFLQNQGFEHVVNIHGGINAWSLELDNSIPQY